MLTASQTGFLVNRTWHMTWINVANIAVLVTGAILALTLGHDSTLAAVMAGAAAGYASGPGGPTRNPQG